jgi:hypothetical protein
MRRSAIVLSILSIGFPMLLRGQEAGIIITEMVKTPPMFGYPAKTRRVKTWIRGDRLRRDEGERSRTIFVLPDSENAWLINHRDSTVTQILPETLQGLSLLGIGMFGIASDSISGKPVIPPRIFRQTGRSQTVNSWRAEEFLVQPNGSQVSASAAPAPGASLWISGEAGLDIGVYLDVLKRMMGPFYEDYAPLMGQFRELKGYPVLVQGSLMGMEISQTLVAVERTEIPDSAFELPNGYKRKMKTNGQ